MFVDGGEIVKRSVTRPQVGKMPRLLPTSEYQLNKTKMDTQWLKAAQENFREALNNKHWEVARAVVLDVADKGFTSESTEMQEELDSRLPNFAQGYVLAILRKKNEYYKAKGLVPTLDMLISDLTQ